MLGNNYIHAKNYDLPNPRKLKINYQNIESTKMAENGKDIVLVQRLMKRTIDMEFQTTTIWGNIIKECCGLNEVYFTLNGERIPGRMRLKSEELKQGSEYITGTDGLWIGQVQFIET